MNDADRGHEGKEININLTSVFVHDAMMFLVVPKLLHMSSFIASDETYTRVVVR